MADLKIGRIVYDINEKDVVLFNGVCWMLLTRYIRNGWYEYNPTMSKTLCNKFAKKNILVLFKKEREYVTQNGQKMGLYYYKFNMEKLEEYLNSNN